MGTYAQKQTAPAKAPAANRDTSATNNHRGRISRSNRVVADRVAAAMKAQEAQTKSVPAHRDYRVRGPEDELETMGPDVVDVPAKPGEEVSEIGDIAEPQDRKLYRPLVNTVTGNHISMPFFPNVAPQLFSSMDEAALAALSRYNPQSIQSMREYGGWIYRTIGGQYGYTDAVVGYADSVNIYNSRVPRRTRIVGDYHAHSDYAHYDLKGGVYPDIVRTTEARASRQNWFSEQDLWLNKSDTRASGFSGYRSYLGTPSGDLFKVSYLGEWSGPLRATDGFVGNLHRSVFQFGVLATADEVNIPAKTSPFGTRSNALRTVGAVHGAADALALAVGLTEQLATGKYEDALVSGGFAAGGYALTRVVGGPVVTGVMLPVAAGLDYHANREAFLEEDAHIGDYFAGFGGSKHPALGAIAYAAYESGRTTGRFFTNSFKSLIQASAEGGAFLARQREVMMNDTRYPEWQRRMWEMHSQFPAM